MMRPKQDLRPLFYVNSTTLAYFDLASRVGLLGVSDIYLLEVAHEIWTEVLIDNVFGAVGAPSGLYSSLKSSASNSGDIPPSEPSLGWLWGTDCASDKSSPGSAPSPETGAAGSLKTP